ncbi:MAG: hypothetical protein ACKVS9_16180 [Phycisphaerae bacterium]
MISRRTRLMAAGLASTTLLWSIDWLTSSKPVTSASAAQPTGISALLPTSRPAPLDVDALIAQVRAASSQPNAVSPLDAMRNPFTATGTLALLEKTPLLAGAAGATASATAAASTQPTLRLHGVITGEQPMAVINSSIVSVGAAIDGYRLREIGRDFVVLIGDEGPLTLRMELP